MKKILVLALFLVVAILTVGCSSNSGGNQGANQSNDNSNSSKDVIELEFSTWYPSNDPIVERFDEWTDMVHEKTEGRVNITWYHNSVLGTSDTMLQDVSAGVFDMAYISPILFDKSEMFPYTIANLAFAISDSARGAVVMQKFLEKYEDPQENIEYLGIGTSDAYVLWSKEPIRTVDDLKGKNIRVASEVQIELTKNWGANPVATPVADMYDALQKGTLDGAIFSLVGAEAWNYHEVAPYITTIRTSNPAFIPVINKDAFASLPEDIQAMFKDDFGPALANIFTDYFSESWDQAIERLNEREGVEVIELSEEETKPFQEDIRRIWNAWVEEANEKGFPGEEMMEDYKALLLEEGLTIPFE